MQFLLNALLALAALAAPQEIPTPVAGYEAGQVWEYRTRPGDEGSLLKIQKVERDPAGQPIYHISLIGVHLRGLSQTELPHLPVSAQTIGASVTRLSRSTAEFPAPDEGIAEWRRANGGVFTIPVAQIVDAVEQTVGGSD